MDSKWPLMLITVALLFGLGFTISQIERTVIMNNWDKRRCDFPVIVASIFFKEENDARSSTEFAKDNFSFCVQKNVDDFLELLMKPINAIFEKQVGLTSNSVEVLNVLRTILKAIYDSFMKLLQSFTSKFNNSVFEMSRVIQYLRMAMRRLNGIMMSLIYTGLTLFTGMLNTIKFIFKVILIICGIMLGIIIILFFILFPFIPMILTVIGIIIYNYAIINNVMNESSGDAISRAQRYKDGFCFSKDTIIACKDGNKNVSDIMLGDELYDGKVTAIIKMHGKDVKLFNLHGIYVSGSHVVKGDKWKSVSEDERAIPTEIESDILYCFNTTSHNIPVIGQTDQKEIIQFRDWEEISEKDVKGQYLWNYFILKKLNNSSDYLKWKDGLKISDTPLMSMKVKTHNGFKDISELQLLDEVLDRNNNTQKVLGVIKGHVKGKKNKKEWHTELYEYDNAWIKGESTVMKGDDVLEGYTLITETGEFIVYDGKENDGKEKIVRDFTDIGYKAIHETYSFVESRLNYI